MEIAIVGMGCIFPGAPDLATYFQNLTRGVDAISQVPAARIDPDVFAKSKPEDNPMYCARGGFIDDYAEFDTLAFGIMPVAARGAEPDQLLALQVAASALEDAGYATRPFRRDRTAVILGRGGYSTAVRSRLDHSIRGAQQLYAALQALLPELDEATLVRVRDELKSQVDAPGPDAVIGIVPNLTASRIANRLDLHGPAWTVDAACASSLIAVEHGCRELTSGRCDMVLAGGVQLCLSDGFWSVFSRLGALSPSEKIRPFDRRADGLVIGEGLGMVVLKRLEDAERDHDCIYAVLRGLGSSSDGRAATLLSPAVEGQVLALERAWQEAGLDPQSVGMVEAHGTATPAGDLAELTTLARVFGERSDGDAPVLGSVKSMIGHAMPAAGAAGLIKAALAVHYGVRFPTLHCEEPHPALAKTRFRVIEKSEPWREPNGRLRVAGVNAFGFGGVNSHAVLEEYRHARQRVLWSSPRSTDLPGERIARFSSDTVEGLLAAVSRGHESDAGGPVRAALLDPTPERLERLRQIIARGKPWRGREACWFSPQGVLSAGGSIAFLFPGINVSFDARLDDVARHFHLPVPPLVKPNTLEEQSYGVVEFSRMVHGLLLELGVKPAHLAGHSVGEWTAMIASGALGERDRAAFMSTLEPGDAPLLDLVFAAAGCDVERARTALEGLSDIVVSHDNCPHQVLLCGRDAPVELALQRLQKTGVMCQKLPFHSGFHTPFFEVHAARFRAELERVPLGAPTLPFWSATTCEPYPDDAEGMRALALRHLLEPVRFRELILRLHRENVRVFLQVGSGGLSHFVEDTLRDHTHVALSSNVADKSGMDQLRRVLATLFVEGADGLAFDRVTARPRKMMKLALGVPLVTTFAPLPVSSVRESADSSPLAAEFRDTLRAMESAQRDVLALLEREPTLPRGPMTWSSPLALSIDTHPYLLDHSLFPQRPGWPTLSDWFSVVPLTMLIDLAMEYAVARFPGYVAIAVENMRALRWFEVSAAVRSQVTCEFDGNDRVDVHVGEHVTCRVVIARSYPQPGADDRDVFLAERPGTFRTRDVYEAGRMFHGPAYQGVQSVDVIGDDGLRGTLRAPSGRASLLDNAGQLFGLWIQERYTDNRMAFPVGARSIRLFGPEPKPGEEVICTIRIRSETDKAVLTDMSLSHQGRVWLSIEGWEDRRFETTPRLWDVLCRPTRELLSVPEPEGFVSFDDAFRMATTRQQLAGRFLCEAERSELAAVKNPMLQRAWLAARIAAKDAVRHRLAASGKPAALFPAEIRIVESAPGVLHAKLPDAQSLHVAVAQHGLLTVAVADEAQVGIAVERVALPASDADARQVSDDERKLSVSETPEETWATLWAAKRAAARDDAAAHALTIRDRNGEQLLVADRWVRTKRRGDVVIAWTTT